MVKKIVTSGTRVFAAVLILVSASLAHAGALVLNGSFSQVGPIGNPVAFVTPGLQTGASAAADWYQFKVVPNGHLETRVEPIAFGLDHQMHLRTDGGPLAPASMGNGVAQSFMRSDCTVAAFSIRVVSGLVTGNLVSTSGSFVSLPQFTATGTWKYYSQGTVVPVTGISFRAVGPDAEYYVRDVQAETCMLGPLTPPPSLIIPPSKLITSIPGSPLLGFKDVSQSLIYSSFDSTGSPGGPVTNIRITNRGSLTIEGPIHILLEGMTPSRSVINPDGDFLGNPFVTLNSAALAPGESEVVVVAFDANAGQHGSALQRQDGYRRHLIRHVPGLSAS